MLRRLRRSPNSSSRRSRYPFCNSLLFCFVMPSRLFRISIFNLCLFLLLVSSQKGSHPLSYAFYTSIPIFFCQIYFPRSNSLLLSSSFLPIHSHPKTVSLLLPLRLHFSLCLQIYTSTSSPVPYLAAQDSICIMRLVHSQY